MAYYASSTYSYPSTRTSSADSRPKYDEREAQRIEQQRQEQRRREQQQQQQRTIVHQDRDRRIPTGDQGFPSSNRRHDAGYRQ